MRSYEIVKQTTEPVRIPAKNDSINSETLTHRFQQRQRLKQQKLNAAMTLRVCNCVTYEIVNQTTGPVIIPAV
ncbi:hypothetical protein HanXRQr2_Chr11g0507151 [Helianthus annuus]|uniref:Uncharacterized protein n=1 Tax=Helianthus annuus TaxID=4232 RepID=A0A9K3HRV6_HELAN|nr:hypothetical protein HanXRQr2_Chr11g0507151 [Helianthus annuus]